MNGLPADVSVEPKENQSYLLNPGKRRNVLVMWVALMGGFAMNGLSADVSVEPKENKAYLLNPGKGWIIYSSFAHASTAAWAKASVGYTRYMWKDIHTNDHTFNWAPIDRDLAECVNRGKRFAFGVMTVSVNSSTDRRGMPPWVADAGAKFLGNGDYKEPIWGDPVFTNKIGQFVAALTKRYNGNPNIEFIDCRTYGNWGEWHLYGCVGKAPSEAILRQYLDQWTGFDQTQIIMPISGGTGMGNGGYGLYARDTCKFGAREDSSETPHRWKTCLPFLNHGPAVAEWSFPYVELKQGKGWTKEIWSHDKLAGQINGSKYSYVCLGEWNGQDADTFLAENGPLVDEWQNKMGYWFKLTLASYPADLANGTTGKLSFRMRNDGVAPIYIKGHSAVVKVALMDNATNVLSTVTLQGVNPFAWKPGETIAQSAEFAFPKNAKGTKLALGVFTKESLANPDIKLGIENGTALNWYVLTDMPRGAY